MANPMRHPPLTPRRYRRYRLCHPRRVSARAGGISALSPHRLAATGAPCGVRSGTTCGQVRPVHGTRCSGWGRRGALQAAHWASSVVSNVTESRSLLRRLNLGGLVGRSAADIFLGLTDVICPDGGAIDEGMARDAWLETVADIEMLDAVDSANLSDTEVREIFLAFVSHSIEVRLFQDIGVNGFKVAPNLGAIEAFEAQFRSYIRLSVRDSFSADLTSLGTVSDGEIRAVVDRTYEEAWELLALLGDVAQ